MTLAAVDVYIRFKDAGEMFVSGVCYKQAFSATSEHVYKNSVQYKLFGDMFLLHCAFEDCLYD